MNLPKQKKLQHSNLHYNKLKETSQNKKSITPIQLLFFTYAIVLIFMGVLKIASLK